MNRMLKKMMRMNRPRTSMSRTIMMFTLGAAVGAGVAMMRGQNHNTPNVESGPVEVDI